MGKRLFLLGTIFFFSADVFAACIQNPNLKNIQARIPNKTYSIQYDDIGTRVLDEFQINYANGPITTFSGNDGRCGNASITANYTNGWLPNANNRKTTVDDGSDRKKWMFFTQKSISGRIKPPAYMAG